MTLVSELLITIFGVVLAFIIFSDYNSSYYLNLISSLNLLFCFIFFAAFICAGNLDLGFVRYKGHFFDISTILGAIALLFAVIFSFLTLSIFIKSKHIENKKFKDLFK